MHARQIDGLTRYFSFSVATLTHKLDDFYILFFFERAYLLALDKDNNSTREYRTRHHNTLDEKENYKYAQQCHLPHIRQRITGKLAIGFSQATAKGRGQPP